MTEPLQIIATLATGIFSGAAIYINLVEHPARMQCRTIIAATQFTPSYKRATVMQVALALTGTVAGIVAWITDSGIEWLIGSVLIFAVIPFTLVAILPTNNKLLNPALDKNSPEALRLLRKWGWLHAVRSLLSLMAFLVFVVHSATK